jgi:hypothetical protein
LREIRAKYKIEEKCQEALHIYQGLKAYERINPK